MIFKWYRIFNVQEFIDTGLASRTLQIQLDGIGLVTFLISSGNTISITYGDVFLPLNFLEMNPFVQGEYASFWDIDGYAWFGFKVEVE